MGKHGRQRRWGIVDIGSNTVRLCVYDIDGKSGFKRVADAKVAAALASYIDDAGRMSDAGVKAGCKAVRKLCRMARLMDCERVFPFATAALRNCANSTEAVAAVQDAAGYPVRVLSGPEEAQLSLRGALTSVDIESGLFFDIGGGSTELMEIRRGVYEGGKSIPMGSLNSWEHGVAGIMPQPGELEELAERAGALLDRSALKLAKRSQVCGIGGTMRLALKAARIIGGNAGGSEGDRNASTASPTCSETRSDGDGKSTSFDNRCGSVASQTRSGGKDNGNGGNQGNGKMRTLTFSQLDGIFEAYLEDPRGFSRALLQVNPARINSFLPGCVIAREILARTATDRLTVSKTGVREGYLTALLEADDKRRKR